MKKGTIFILALILIIIIVGVVIFVTTRGEKEDLAAENIGNREGMQTSKYELKNDEKDLTPYHEFSKDAFGEPQGYSEIPSCAFEGVDKVYTYADYEITTTMLGGKEVIYSTYLLTDAVSTPEGVKIADEKAAMIAAYGEEYTENGTEYIYLDGNVSISFITENDVITSIQYTMVTE